MRRAFVHEADLDLAPGADEGAPGAAVTAELCGYWDHEPPCPLAPHHTEATRSEATRSEATRSHSGLHLRILFATEPEQESAVRRRIVAALAAGRLATPDGQLVRWRLLDARPDAVRPDEHDHARRLTTS